MLKEMFVALGLKRSSYQTWIKAAAYNLTHLSSLCSCLFLEVVALLQLDNALQGTNEVRSKI